LYSVFGFSLPQTKTDRHRITEKFLEYVEKLQTNKQTNKSASNAKKDWLIFIQYYNQHAYSVSFDITKLVPFSPSSYISKFYQTA
jgi:hypothetical protein